MTKTILIILSALLPSTAQASQHRWFSEDMVQRGHDLFQTNCAVCHGKQAEGTEDWRSTGPDGKYPPPPLNGTAHTWHHDISTLKNVIQNGGIRLGGSMPPFRGRINERDMDDLIAFFQSKWSDEIYKIWSDRYLVD